MFEHAPERFQNSAFEIEIIFLVENLDQTRDTHDQADHSIGVAREITGQAVVFAELRDQDRATECAQNVHSCQKIGVIELSFRKQILQRHLHQHDQILFRTTRLFQKLATCAFQHVVGRISHRPKTASFNQDRFLVQNLRGLHHFAVGREHHRVGQTLAHQLQTHQPIVDLSEGRPGKLD